MNSPTPLVLVFDRDADTRAWYRAAFVSTDYRVVEASDGTLAVNAMASQLPDLVIAELRTQHRDGLTLCVIKWSRAATAEIPLLMVLLDGDSDARVAARFVGASELLDKPPTPTGVLAVASRLILAQPQGQIVRRQLYRTLSDLQDGGEDDGVADHLDSVAIELQARRLLARVAPARSSVVLANDDGKCVAVNVAACSLTGYSEAELLARFVWDLVPSEVRDNVRLQWAQFLVNHECAGTFDVVRKEGARVTVQLCALSNVAPGLHATAVARESAASS